MGEAACALQGFYDPPGSANGEEEAIPVPRLLEGSISFGRYVSESLEWGKWSSFNQNRYLEEAEKYSKPGSVAQKKAYFEAHHKRIAAQKAAALLEQANAANNGGPKEGTDKGGNHTHENTHSANQTQLAKSKVEVMASNVVQEIKEPESDASAIVSPPNNSCSTERAPVELIEQEDHAIEDHTVLESPSGMLSSCELNNSSSEKETCEQVKSDEEDTQAENRTLAEGPSRVISSETFGDVENQNAITEAETSRTCQPAKPPLRESSAANRDNSASKEKKQKLSVSKWPVFGRKSTALPSSKPVTSSHPRKESASGLSSKKSMWDANNKKILSPNLSPMPSIFCSQVTGETTPSTTKSIPKVEKNGESGLVTKHSKISPMIPCCGSQMVSTVRMPKLAALTPQSDTKRSRAPLQKADPRGRKINPVSQSVSTNCWKSSSSNWKRPSHIVCSPFSFRCEERAEKRKEFFLKLEEKLNAEKLQRQAKAKEMAEDELKRLRQSLGFKARPMPDFYHKTEPLNNETKIPPAQSPKLRRKINPIEVPVTDCLPSLRSSSRKTESMNATTEKSGGKKVKPTNLASGEKRPDNNISSTK